MKNIIIRFIVWHLPKPIIYWSAIRLGVNATQGEHSNQIVPNLKFIDALKRWE